MKGIKAALLLLELERWPSAIPTKPLLDSV